MEVPMTGEEDLEEILKGFSTEESRSVFLKQYCNGMNRYSEYLKYLATNNIVMHYLSMEMYSEAAEIAIKENLLWKAFDICSQYLKERDILVKIGEKANDQELVDKVAFEIGKMGYVDQAVSLYRKIGNLKQAGKHLAASGKVDDAFKCYDEGGHYFEALELAKKIGADDKAKFYEKVLLYLGRLVQFKPHT